MEHNADGPVAGCVREAGGHDLRQDVGEPGRGSRAQRQQGHAAHRHRPAQQRQLQLLVAAAQPAATEVHSSSWVAGLKSEVM